MDIPVYLINGFLESGKTSFIKTTLEDPEFINKERILLLVCEEGMEEYDVESYAKKNIFVSVIDDIDDFNFDNLTKISDTYKPDKVIIELNGVWKMEDFLEVDTPQKWVTVQIITLVNAETFDNYINNMRSMIMEHLKYSDTIIFNRCNASTDKMLIRRTIKPVNRKAQIIYESENGIDTGDEGEDELPFDYNQNSITIEDDDYGLFYLDILDNPKRYDGKEICFKAQYYRDPKMPKDTFVPGRFAMQCCANDIGFIGIISRIPSSLKEFFETHRDKDWIYVKAKVRVEFKREYRGKGPVLYVTELSDSVRADDDIVYFT